jgi:hypothetical protein
MVYQDVRTYKFDDENTGRTKSVKIKYTILMRDNKVFKVFNDAFNGWGHSALPTSEIFEYYSKRFNK